MPRRARIAIPGLPHHVTHRGNRGGETFFSDGDRDSYLRRLLCAGAHLGLELWAYCLMTNHVHLIVRPARRDSLAHTIRQVHGQHARVINRAQSWSGHLWANRYYSTPLGPEHLWAAVRYVESNPVRAGLVRVAEDYPWSSARSHCGLAPDGPLSPERPFPGPYVDWAAWLARGTDTQLEQEIRTSTIRGTGTPHM
jgi:putative transposase